MTVEPVKLRQPCRQSRRRIAAVLDAMPVTRRQFKALRRQRLQLLLLRIVETGPQHRPKIQRTQLAQLAYTCQVRLQPVAHRSEQGRLGKIWPWRSEEHT